MIRAGSGAGLQWWQNQGAAGSLAAEGGREKLSGETKKGSCPGEDPPAACLNSGPGFASVSLCDPGELSYLSLLQLLCLQNVDMMVPTSKGGCTMRTVTEEPFEHRTLSKNSLNTMGRPVGLVAHQREAIWATPDGQADIWGVGEEQTGVYIPIISMAISHGPSRRINKRHL